MSLWGSFEVPKDGCARLAFGEHRVYVKRIEDEWLFSNAVKSEGAQVAPEAAGLVDIPRGEQVSDTVSLVSDSEIPSGVEWLRLVSARDESLELIPALPDRPLVIRPESPVSIFPGRYARFYIAVPIWFRFVAVRGKERINVIDVPSRILSNTWFGDPASGQLCYSLDAPLKRASEQIDDGFTSATCVLIVRNGSTEKLNFERICTHVESLGVFSGSGRLWTNEIRVLFKGVEQVSQISIQKLPPDAVGKPVELCEPRIPPNRGVLGRSFSFIRQFAGM